MIVLVFLMLSISVLFIFVTPLPVIPLLTLIELIVTHVLFMSLFQPVPIRFIFLRIPIVIVTILRIVHPVLAVFPLLLLVPFVIILGRGHC